jgi:hypothetical protein
MRVKASMNGRQTEIIHVGEVDQRARIPFVHTTTKKKERKIRKKRKKNACDNGGRSTGHAGSSHFALASGHVAERLFGA